MYYLESSVAPSNTKLPKHIHEIDIFQWRLKLDSTDMKNIGQLHMEL